MNLEKLNSAILGLEDLTEKAEELHAIVTIHWDSFVESDAMSNESEVYKTMASVIERLARELSEELLNKFKELHSLSKEARGKSVESL